MKKGYVIYGLVHSEFITGESISISKKDGCLGFFPCFTTRQDAEKYADKFKKNGLSCPRIMSFEYKEKEEEKWQKNF